MLKENNIYYYNVLYPSAVHYCTIAFNDTVNKLFRPLILLKVIYMKLCYSKRYQVSLYLFNNIETQHKIEIFLK